MKKSETPKGLFQLGLISALALSLAAFEWTAKEWTEPAGWSYAKHNLLEAELIPVHSPGKPLPPIRAIGVAPEIKAEPIPEPVPAPIIDPNFDPLEGKLFKLGFVDEGGDDEIETLLIAEHMPHFDDCQNVLNRGAERICSEAKMISLIQRCATFPKHLKEAGVGGVVYIEFNVNEHGDIMDQRVLKSAHPSLDKSALNALDCIPKMTPGTQQGRPVRVTYTIPVRFTIR